MNSVSSNVLSLAMPQRRFPERAVFIRRLPEHDDEIFGFVHAVYQALDEFGNIVQTYGGDSCFAFKTAREDKYIPFWAH